MAALKPWLVFRLYLVKSCSVAVQWGSKLIQLKSQSSIFILLWLVCVDTLGDVVVAFHSWSTWVALDRSKVLIKPICNCFRLRGDGIIQTEWAAVWRLAVLELNKIYFFKDSRWNSDKVAAFGWFAGTFVFLKLKLKTKTTWWTSSPSMVCQLSYVTW